MAQAEVTQAPETGAENTGHGFEELASYIQNDWVTTLAVALVVLVVTSWLAHFLASFIKRVMNSEGSLIPANSLFLNIVRALVWTTGLSLMLSLCFDVDVSAFVAALGVGGIALSLGMQDTISNMIGGLNVSISGLVKPGDHIKLDTTGFQGVVCDVTLRQTVIEDRVKNRIIVPNASMNTSTITKLQPTTHLVIPVVVRAEDARLTVVAHRMEKAVECAVQRVSKIRKRPRLTFVEITDYGYRGTMVFDIADANRVLEATDAAVRAMALYAHGEVPGVCQHAAERVSKSKDSTISIDDVPLCSDVSLCGKEVACGKEALCGKELVLDTLALDKEQA